MKGRDTLRKAGDFAHVPVETANFMAAISEAKTPVVSPTYPVPITQTFFTASCRSLAGKSKRVPNSSLAARVTSDNWHFKDLSEDSRLSAFRGEFGMEGPVEGYPGTHGPTGRGTPRRPISQRPTMSAKLEANLGQTHLSLILRTSSNALHMDWCHPWRAGTSR